ncbi:GM13812 [Drosophila sechellia]|uniref:GM13812 n=1 Tax=Drosophila sechellia TaxID=7238 RepID=B4HUY7_DROSE|nr:GM13812 [Drosophila sechellia]
MASSWVRAQDIQDTRAKNERPGHRRTKDGVATCVDDTQMQTNKEARRQEEAFRAFRHPSVSLNIDAKYARNAGKTIREWKEEQEDKVRRRRRSHVPQKGKTGVGGLIIIISSKNGISRGRVQKQEL